MMLLTLLHKLMASQMLYHISVQFLHRGVNMYWFSLTYMTTNGKNFYPVPHSRTNCYIPVVSGCSRRSGFRNYPRCLPTNVARLTIDSVDRWKLSRHVWVGGLRRGFVHVFIIVRLDTGRARRARRTWKVWMTLLNNEVLPFSTNKQKTCSFLNIGIVWCIPNKKNVGPK